MTTPLQIIEAIEEFYRFEDLGKVLKWADNKYNNRWTQAVDRLDRALGQFQNNPGSVNIDAEYKLYLDTLLPLLAEYKSLNPETIQGFLKMLRSENRR